MSPGGTPAGQFEALAPGPGGSVDLGRLTLELDASGDGTELTQTVEDTVLPRIPLVGRLLDRLYLKRELTRVTVDAVRNAKRMAESTADAEAQ